MKYPSQLLMLVLVSNALAQTLYADTVISISSADFTTTSVYNNVASFNFEIILAGTLAPGLSYTNPPLRNVSYTVVGVLPSPTPSGFSGFNLVRNNIDGAEFYNLSPESGISFSISSTADLSDGLQLNELSGSTDALILNAREFNQNPGRYHPPILRLNADGSGSVANANNQSTFPNPPPPMGSGMLVNVAVGDEYDVNLTASPAIALTGPIASSVRVPLISSPLAVFCLVIGVGYLSRMR